jgi:energy-coupling factor transport system permease protein
MIISLSLRFVPSLVSEAKIILRAQASRGVDFSNGNIKDKVKSLVSLIVPMFSIAFKKAEDLANSMGARGFNPRLARSRYRQYNLNFTSISILTFVSLLFGFLMYFAIKHLIFGPFALIDGLY